MISPFTYLDITPTPIHDAADHYAFHPYPTDDFDAALRTYTSFIPSNQHDNTHLNNGEWVIQFNHNDETNRWEYKKSYNTYISLPETGSEAFQTELNNLLEQKFKNKRNSLPGQLWKNPQTEVYKQSSKNMFPNNIRDRLFSIHHTKNPPHAPWYEFHKQHPTKTDLKTLTNIGDTYADALKNQAKYSPYDSPDHQSIASCPNCNATWKATYPEYIMKDTRALQALLYCPECAHTDISTTHITAPQKLTLD